MFPFRNVILFFVFLLASGMVPTPTRADDLVATGPDVERQFDFWIGEWQVNNRFLGPDGEWYDRGTARATIVPILDGRALVERWSGTTNGNKTIGFSLRSWHPDEGRWAILLNWPGGGRPSFGTMKGSFRHGRGEFFSGEYTDAQGRPTQQRFTFSDARLESCRWDSATTHDGGKSWRTTWIMEFTRKRTADRVSEDELFAPVDETCHCTQPEARQFDFLIGSWVGTGTDGSSHRLDAAAIVEQCMIVERLSSQLPDGSSVTRFAVRAFVPASGRWESTHMEDRSPDWVRAVGSVGRRRAQLETRDASQKPVARFTWEGFRDGDGFRYLEEITGDGGEWGTRFDVDFRRAPGNAAREE